MTFSTLFRYPEFATERDRVRTALYVEYLNPRKIVHQMIENEVKWKSVQDSAPAGMSKKEEIGKLR